MEVKKEQSEVARQFAEIFEDHNDPFKKEEREMEKNREERSRIIQEDTGL